MQSERLASYPGSRHPDRPLDPPAGLLRRCEHEPVSRVSSWGGDAWLVTGYHEAREAFSSNSLSVNPRAPGFPEKSASYAATLSSDQTLRTLDDPVHAQQKRMIMYDFTVRRVERLRPRLDQLVAGLIDTMLASPRPAADLVTALALPVPTTVICEILGVPYEDRELFGRRAEVCFSSASTRAEASVAGQELNEYLAGQVERRLSRPASDLIGRLVSEQLLTGALTEDEVIQMCRLILLAGHETTANSIALSVLALLRDGEQRAVMMSLASDAELLTAADELLRFVSPTHMGRRRACVADTRIGDQLIRAGEGVIIANNVCDRDAAVFPDPGRLDLRRRNAAESLTFGWGTHQCPGRYLSRVELLTVHASLWRRLPGLRLAVPFEELAFKHEATVFGLASLPVTWE